MAKLTFDQAKAELVEIEASLKIYKDAGATPMKMVTDRFEYLMKILTGNASAQVAEIFNTSIGAVINAEGNEALKAEIVKAVGTKVKLTVSIVEGAIKFEAAGSSGGGTGGTGGSGATGGTKASSEYNHYSVKNKITGEVTEHDSAADAVKHILNGGENAMNLPTGYGSGNSMKRVICDYLPKNEVFKATFEVTPSYIAPVKKVAEPAATEPAAE